MYEPRHPSFFPAGLVEEDGLVSNDQMIEVGWALANGYMRVRVRLTNHCTGQVLNEDGRALGWALQDLPDGGWRIKTTVYDGYAAPECILVEEELGHRWCGRCRKVVLLPSREMS